MHQIIVKPLKRLMDFSVSLTTNLSVKDGVNSPLVVNKKIGTLNRFIGFQIFVNLTNIFLLIKRISANLFGYTNIRDNGIGGFNCRYFKK